MDMTWHDLLFMHWPIAIDRLRALIPGALEIDTFGGEAWIGVVPFRMTRVKPYGFPPVPACSAFPELNVRTYVTDGEKAGVWFFSLDAANRFAVAVARAVYHLPYFNARMALQDDGKEIAYRSVRTHRRAGPARFEARYRPTGDRYLAAAGTLEFWLTERYCLYSTDAGGRLLRADIHHARWPLQPAEAEVAVNTMTAPLGIALPGAPLLHFARGAGCDRVEGGTRPLILNQPAVSSVFWADSRSRI